MTKLVEKTKSSRQTFTIPQYIVDRLEAYAKSHHKKKSQIVAKALEEYLEKEDRSQKVAKRLEALEEIVGILPKGSTKDKKIQDILGI